MRKKPLEKQEGIAKEVKVENVKKETIDGCDRTDSSNRNADGGDCSAPAKSESDSFYERLCKLYESSGLSVVFNFREASFDLYLFYKEVTERGGYYQVTKEGRWGEVASALNSKSKISMVADQFQKFYANLLYHFEQLYYYRTQVKPAATPGNSCGNGNSSTGKRKEWEDSSHSSIIEFGKGDGPVEKKKCNTNSCDASKGNAGTGENLQLETVSNLKELRKTLKAPLATRTAYQIFMREECVRLKKIHGETSGSLNIRDMAVDAWRYLSESERQPYVEESRKDKERYKQEMIAYVEESRQEKERYHQEKIAYENLVKVQATRTADTYGTNTDPVLADANKQKTATDPEANVNNTKTSSGDAQADSDNRKAPSNPSPGANNRKLLTLETECDYHVKLLPGDDENPLLLDADESVVEKAVSLMKNARADDPIFQVNWDDDEG